MLDIGTRARGLCGRLCYPELSAHQNRFLQRGCKWRPCGSGHAGDKEERVKRDVLRLHPSVITIMPGMNDGRYTTELENNVRGIESEWWTRKESNLQPVG
jgi:hypothetical protein